MRTARLLTGRGVGAVHNRKWHYNTPRGQTNACENIALPQTSFAGGN